MTVVKSQDQSPLRSAVEVMRVGNAMALGSGVPRLHSTKATSRSQVSASAAIAQANFIETLSAASSELEASTGKLTETAAARIGELINIIAGQTSLLALKATIEAMRAGEAESAFAVLAWKALAEQTAKAIAEISQQIAGIEDAASLSLDAVEAISGTIERMLQSCSLIACAAEEQSGATQEICRYICAYQNLVQEIRWQAGLSAFPPRTAWVIAGISGSDPVFLGAGGG